MQNTRKLNSRQTNTRSIRNISEFLRRQVGPVRASQRCWSNNSSFLGSFSGLPLRIVVSGCVGDGSRERCRRSSPVRIHASSHKDSLARLTRLSTANVTMFFARSRTRASHVGFANQSERSVSRKPRAGARGHLPARPTSGTRVDATRVYPGRGAPRFASGRRRGAGEVARKRERSRRWPTWDTDDLCGS